MIEKNFNNIEILEAIEILLNKNKKKLNTNKYNNNESILPKDTETIIKQAENYLKN